MKSSFRAPNQLSRNSLRIPRKPARAALRVSAIFERCTERSIRAFLISQQEAKRCGPTTEVRRPRDSDFFSGRQFGAAFSSSCALLRHNLAATNPWILLPLFS
eukprot:1161030-Pelagomonas_calceolata.AAC.6